MLPETDQNIMIQETYSVCVSVYGCVVVLLNVLTVWKRGRRI